MSVLIFALASCDKLMETGVERQMSKTRTDMLTDGNLHVVLVGSGGPFPNTERVSVSTAVIAGGEFILVDTGPGAARNALLQNLPLGELSAVFLGPGKSEKETGSVWPKWSGKGGQRVCPGL